MKELFHNISESKIAILISIITVVFSIISKYLISRLQAKEDKKSITISIKKGDQNVVIKNADLSEIDIKKIIEDFKTSEDEETAK